MWCSLHWSNWPVFHCDMAGSSIHLYARSYLLDFSTIECVGVFALPLYFLPSCNLSFGVVPYLLGAAKALIPFCSLLPLSTLNSCKTFITLPAISFVCTHVG